MNLYEWEINNDSIKLLANSGSEFNRVLIAKAILKDNRIVIYYHGEEKIRSEYYCSMFNVYEIQKIIVGYINYNLIKSLNNNVNITGSSNTLEGSINNYIKVIKLDKNYKDSLKILRGVK